MQDPCQVLKVQESCQRPLPPACELALAQSLPGNKRAKCRRTWVWHDSCRRDFWPDGRPSRGGGRKKVPESKKLHVILKK